MDGRLGGAAAQAARGVAVETVLGDVNVEGAEIDGAKLVEKDEDLAEVVCIVSLAALLFQVLELAEDPAVHERELVGLHRIFCGVESVQIAQQHAQRVAEAAVTFGGLLEQLF